MVSSGRVTIALGFPRILHSLLINVYDCDTITEHNLLVPAAIGVYVSMKTSLGTGGHRIYYKSLMRSVPECSHYTSISHLGSNGARTADALLPVYGWKSQHRAAVSRSTILQSQQLFIHLDITIVIQDMDGRSIVQNMFPNLLTSSVPPLYNTHGHHITETAAS